VRAGYLSQHGEDLDARSTALELCRAVRDDETWIRTLLGCWKMPAERVHRPASALSAGERTKVALARLLLSEVNLLLLDEPANHLEIESVEALAATLEQFPGTLVFATHDRWLAARLATRTVALPDEAGRTSSRTRR
jgi:ATPase subunit of ABC transporter with duplicated ATPase domains